MLKPLLLSLLLVATCASAKTDPSKGEYFQNSTGIITPDVATAMTYSSRFTVNTNGDMVVCVEPAKYDTYSYECNKTGNHAKNTGWKLATSLVPAGKTYTGFKVVRASYAQTFLEIYWK